MTKQNFSKKDLQRLEEKHIKELLADSLYSCSDDVDINVLSSVYKLLNELGFSEYVYHMNRLQYLCDYDYTEENYYDKDFPNKECEKLCSGCHRYDCNGECIGD